MEAHTPWPFLASFPQATENHSTLSWYHVLMSEALLMIFSLYEFANAITITITEIFDNDPNVIVSVKLSYT